MYNQSFQVCKTELRMTMQHNIIGIGTRTYEYVDYRVKLKPKFISSFLNFSDSTLIKYCIALEGLFKKQNIINFYGSPVFAQGSVINGRKFCREFVSTLKVQFVMEFISSGRDCLLRITISCSGYPNSRRYSTLQLKFNYCTKFH